MSEWKGLLHESPVSRIRKLSESPTLDIKECSRTLHSLNNISSSFKTKVDLGQEPVTAKLLDPILISRDLSRPTAHSGFDVLRRMSPFKSTRKRKLFDDEDKNLGPEVKVRVIDCTQQQDFHFIGKVRDATLFIGWKHNFSTRSNKKQLLYEDKSCERVDLGFALDLSDLSYLSWDLNSSNSDDELNLYSPDNRLDNHPSMNCNKDTMGSEGRCSLNSSFNSGRSASSTSSLGNLEC